MNDIPAIVKVRLTSTVKGETQGFGAPEWVTYSSSEELRNTWAEENRLRDGSEVIVACMHAKRKAKELLSTHQPEPLDKSVQEELRRIVKEAWNRKQRRK